MSQNFQERIQPILDHITEIFSDATHNLDFQDVITDEDMKILLASPRLIHLHSSIISFYQINQPYTLAWSIPNKIQGYSEVKPINSLEIVTEGNTEYFFLQTLKYATVLLHLLSGAIYFVPIFDQCKDYSIIQVFNSINDFYEYQAKMYFIDGWELSFIGMNYTAMIRFVLLRLNYKLLNVLDNYEHNTENKMLDNRIKQIARNAQITIL